MTTKIIYNSKPDIQFSDLKVGDHYLPYRQQALRVKINNTCYYAYNEKSVFESRPSELVQPVFVNIEVL